MAELEVKCSDSEFKTLLIMHVAVTLTSILKVKEDVEIKFWSEPVFKNKLQF